VVPSAFCAMSCRFRIHRQFESLRCPSVTSELLRLLARRNAARGILITLVALIAVPLGRSVATAQEGGAASCPLPLSQQIKAVKAFTDMMPVFRHPRCFNCHGGFDIASDAHPGADFVTNSGIDWRDLLSVRQRQKLHEGCDTCHSNVEGSQPERDGVILRGWLIAPPPMRWVGKSDEKICLDMKRFEPTGDGFVAHIQNDKGEIQFIKVAFRGDRALVGKDLEEYVPVKPPGSQDELVAKAKKWVQLLGKGYAASPDCGCVVPRFELKWRMTAEQNIPKAFKISSSTSVGPVSVELDENGAWTSPPLTPATSSSTQLAPALAKKCSLGKVENPRVRITVKPDGDATDVVIEYLNDAGLPLSAKTGDITPGTPKLHCPGLPAGAPFALTLTGGSFHLSAADLASRNWSEHDADGMSLMSMYGSFYSIKVDQLSVRAVAP
jgi:hypothetical protein